MSWTKEWCLKFNVDKFKVMQVAHAGQHQYVLDGVKLQEVLQERDLGVEVSSSLKPSLQCTNAAAKAMQVLGIIKRYFVMHDEEDFRLLFNGYVRPYLEYCVQVWNPYLKKDIECLEKVQRRATKLVKGLKNRPYSERLALLRTSSLEKRWREDLIQAYRIVKGIDKVNMEHFFEMDDGGGHDVRGHWAQPQSKGSAKSASATSKILQPKRCLCLEQFAVFSRGCFVHQDFQEETR